MDGEGIFVSEGGWSEEGFAFMIWGERDGGVAQRLKVGRLDRK